AAVVVDVIDLGVPLGAADAILFGVLRGLDVDAVRRAGRGAKETGHALFQAVFIALQHVQSAEPLLKYRTLHGSGAVGIVLDDRGLEHLPKGYGHSFGNAGDIAKDRHEFSIAVQQKYGNWLRLE